MKRSRSPTKKLSETTTSEKTTSNSKIPGYTDLLKLTDKQLTRKKEKYQQQLQSVEFQLPEYKKLRIKTRQQLTLINKALEAPKSVRTLPLIAPTKQQSQPKRTVEQNNEELSKQSQYPSSSNYQSVIKQKTIKPDDLTAKRKGGRGKQIKKIKK